MQNYSTDDLSATASIRNNFTPASTHGFCHAVYFRSGDGTTVMVGIPGSEFGATNNQGAVYAFDLMP